MATDGPETSDAASFKDRSAAEDAGGQLSWFARGMGEAQGKKVERRHCG